MLYTTISVALVAGHEKDGINAAIEQGLSELSEEIGGPVELVHIIPVPLDNIDLCLIIMARAYTPLALGGGGIPMQEALMHLLKER